MTNPTCPAVTGLAAIQLPIIKTSQSHMDRESMPQIDDLKDFLKWLKHKKVPHRFETLAAKHLRPRQNQIDLNKVFQLLGLGLNTIRYPVIVSSDRVILDGDHRWYAAKTAMLPVHCVVVDREEYALFNLVKQYPQATHQEILTKL